MSGTPLVVLTADQRRSRRGIDRVPDALEALAAGTAGVPAPPPRLAAERTAGDEIQTVLDSALATVLSVERLTRCGGWRIGVGVGSAEHPLPSSTRAARGDAFVAARAAVDAARSSGTHLALRTADDRSPTVVGPTTYGDLDPARAAEHALAMLVTVLAGRTEAGWEIVDLIDAGLTGKAAAARLDISESAVSQRLSRAAHEEGLRARELAVHHLARLGVAA